MVLQLYYFHNYRHFLYLDSSGNPFHNNHNASPLDVGQRQQKIIRPGKRKFSSRRGLSLKVENFESLKKTLFFDLCSVTITALSIDSMTVIPPTVLNIQPSELLRTT